MESVRVGDYEVRFDQHATRWLGIWIDSKTTLKGHHAARMMKVRKAMHCPTPDGTTRNVPGRL